MEIAQRAVYAHDLQRKKMMEESNDMKKADIA
jgi:hypothetical protein